MQEDKEERCALSALKTHAVISVFDVLFPFVAVIQPPWIRPIVIQIYSMRYQAWLPLVVIWLNFGTLREALAQLGETFKEVAMKFVCCQDQIPLFDVQQ